MRSSLRPSSKASNAKNHRTAGIQGFEHDTRDKLTRKFDLRFGCLGGSANNHTEEQAHIPRGEAEGIEGISTRPEEQTGKDCGSVVAWARRERFICQRVCLENH
jgi:hypothetical protein